MQSGSFGLTPTTSQVLRMLAPLACAEAPPRVDAGGDAGASASAEASLTLRVIWGPGFVLLGPGCFFFGLVLDLPGDATAPAEEERAHSSLCLAFRTLAASVQNWKVTSSTDLHRSATTRAISWKEAIPCDFEWRRLALATLRLPFIREEAIGNR